MSLQQRTALGSAVVALILVALKLTVGLLSHSLGLIAEAIHSATDLLAALMTFFALGVAVRPADSGHPFGHGRAEHLSALGEGAVLVLASIAISVQAVSRLASGSQPVQATWYGFAVAGAAIVLDGARWRSSSAVARRQSSAALQANALHFALDMVGSGAVIVGLALVRLGYRGADSVAALLVAALVLFSAGRVMRRSVAVLMDSSPAAAERAARDAIARLPAVRLRRLRMRVVGGRHFADVVVGVRAGTDVSGGHAIASRIEHAVHEVLPGSDVVVHVEPDAELVQPATKGGRLITVRVRLTEATSALQAEQLRERIEAELSRHPEVAAVDIEEAGPG